MYELDKQVNLIYKQTLILTIYIYIYMNTRQVIEKQTHSKTTEISQFAKEILIDLENSIVYTGHIVPLIPGILRNLTDMFK